MTLYAARPKLCCYCHHEPRRAGSCYCCDACAEKKRAQNARNVRAYRQRESEAGQVIYANEVATLREAQAIRDEPDAEPQRLTPPQMVRRLNVRTGKVEEVKV